MNVLQAELLINTRSRRGASALATITSEAKNAGIEFTKVHQFKRGSEIDPIVTDILSRKPGLLIVGSGDGTVSTVVGRLAGSDIAVGIIPLGTTNNFARSLDIPLDIPGSLRRIVSSPPLPVDLGSIQSHKFANVAGIGVTSQIAQGVTNKQKKHFGRLAYFFVGMQQFLVHKPFEITIEDKDSELQMHLETHQVIIANGRFHAGKQIAVEAEVDNRELILFTMGGRSRLSFLRHSAGFYFGSRRSIRHASYLVGRDVVISTSRPQLIEVDGEIKGDTKEKISASVVPKAIRIRYKENK